MNTSRTNTFSFLFWIHKQRANVNGEMPIFKRVTVDGKRAEISLQRYISEKDWDVKAQRVKPKANNSVVINNYMDMARGKVQNTYNQLTIINCPLFHYQLSIAHCQLEQGLPNPKE